MSLPDGMDYLMRPVARGMCKFESLKNGDLSLADVALLNDTIDVQDENERRAMESRK